MEEIIEKEELKKRLDLIEKCMTSIESAVLMNLITKSSYRQMRFDLAKEKRETIESLMHYD